MQEQAECEGVKVAEEAEEGDVPRRIRVSGLPFMLQGWNTVYDRIDDIGGHPAYRLRPYTLYRLFPIIGCTIHFSPSRKTWIMERDCDAGWNDYVMARVSEWDYENDYTCDECPCGVWEYGAMVTHA